MFGRGGLEEEELNWIEGKGIYKKVTRVRVKSMSTSSSFACPASLSQLLIDRLPLRCMHRSRLPTASTIFYFLKRTACTIWTVSTFQQQEAMLNLLYFICPLWCERGFRQRVDICQLPTTLECLNVNGLLQTNAAKPPAGCWTGTDDTMMIQYYTSTPYRLLCT